MVYILEASTGAVIRENIPTDDCDIILDVLSNKGYDINNIQWMYSDKKYKILTDDA